MYNQETIKELKISSLNPPVICNSLSGQRYMVITGPNGGWFEITNDITYKQILSCWTRKDYPSKKYTDSLINEWSIQSSKGDISYTVKLKDFVWSCTCPSFGFKRRCKHIELVKKNLK